MRAVRPDGTDVKVVDVEEPQGEGVVVDVVAAGICGSDLHLLDAGFLQVTPGHEIAGRTSDGTAVAISTPGDDGDDNDGFGNVGGMFKTR